MIACAQEVEQTPCSCKCAQIIGDAVAAWLPDHLGFDHFAANYSQSYNPGVDVSAVGFSYAPCIIGNFPAGAVVAPTAISISPLGVYITPEGANVQPEGMDVRAPPALHPRHACLTRLAAQTPARWRRRWRPPSSVQWASMCSSASSM